MATKDLVHRVEYFTLTVEDKPGQASTLQKGLTRENVQLLGMLAFPAEKGRTQVDLVPEHPEDLRKAAKKVALELRGPKTAFLVHGQDRVGALSEIFQRLGDEGIGIRATLGVTCGANRFGALLWVAPSDVEATSRMLGATVLATHHV